MDMSLSKLGNSDGQGSLAYCSCQVAHDSNLTTTTENMNRPIAAEIEPVIKKLQINKSPGPHAFTGEFYQTLTEELTFTLLKLFKKLQRKEPFLIHSLRPPSP